jgi:XTP/dITP diphosphohydrolase
MQKLVIATKNKGKVAEIKDILADMDVEVVSMLEEGIDIEVEEDGTTFEENALKKAREIKAMTNAIVMADDSGLEVDYLDGQPGIYSARFSGEGATIEKNNQKLLALMEGVKEQERTARYVCAIAVVFNDDTYFVVRGQCEGMIGREHRGTHGFGYDPLFYLPEYGKTMAELGPEVKNKISHRARALEKVKEKLKQMI